MSEMKYSIDLEKNIIYCTFAGHLSAEKLIECIGTIRDDPLFHKNLNTIADIQAVTFREGFLEMRKIADFVKKTSAVRGNFRLALIASESNADSASIYNVLSKDPNGRVCFRMEDAEVWAGVGATVVR